MIVFQYLFLDYFQNVWEQWRSFGTKNSIDIILYLDDGFGMAKNAEVCKKNAEFVKQSLEDIINIEKSILVLSKPQNG